MRAVLGALLLVALPAIAQDLVVGVLEHPQCKETEARAVRPLFTRQESRWRALDQPPPPFVNAVDWYAVDAHASGYKIRTQAAPPFPEDSWIYRRDFLLGLAPGSVLPSFPNTDKVYAGWCDAPANKPVVIVTGGGERTPRLTSLPRIGAAHDMAQLLRAFNASLGAARLCRKPNDRKPIYLGTADLVIAEHLQLRSGARLVALSLRRELADCASERGDVELPRWFVVESGRQRFLGASLAFIAAADLDADGTIEYLF